MPPAQQPQPSDSGQQMLASLMQLQSMMNAGAQSQVQNTTNPPPAIWGSQIPALPFPAMVPSMPNFGMPQLNIQQAMAEALSLCVPVTANDEPLLLQRLLECAKTAGNYRLALESLHGCNNHSASLWKDYYLDNKKRLDDWIDKLKRNDSSADQPNQDSSSKKHALPTVKKPMHALPTLKRPTFPTSKKPNPPTLKTESPQPGGSRQSSAKPTKWATKKRASTPPLPVEATAGRRHTINSITAPSPVFDARLPPPNVDVKIPEPPSRSPTPPSQDTLVLRATGYKYTEVDREFFHKFIAWELKKNPHLNRGELCKLLAEKAPHHPANSWASFWSNNHDVPDKILAAAARSSQNGEAPEGSEDSDSSDEVIPVSSRMKYRDPSTSTRQSSASAVDRSPSDAGLDDEPVEVYSESEMGQAGHGFTKADMYITAKHIASFDNWKGMNGRARWEEFAERFPQRSHKSWAEYFRRNDKELLKLARKISAQNKQRYSSDSSNSPTPPQMVRPTNPPVKRKAVEGDGELDSSPKRGRFDSTP